MLLLGNHAGNLAVVAVAAPEFGASGRHGIKMELSSIISGLRDVCTGSDARRRSSRTFRKAGSRTTAQHVRVVERWHAVELMEDEWERRRPDRTSEGWTTRQAVWSSLCASDVATASLLKQCMAS